MKHSSSKKDSLSLLEVFDKLQVGPVKLSSTSLKMPYTIYYSGKKFSYNLIYSYQEKVFNVDDPADENLASMIGAQVALNYGLFCRKIAFIGPFTARDMNFLHEMMDNTSQEIYVKKFLEPHPFIIGKAANIPVIKKIKYTRAKLEFLNNDYSYMDLQAIPWETVNSRYCILSSGGKDSLLSYGLINELGKETHPIYINESGRHWYTALNAFRYSAKHIPNTAKVWTNCDRLFNWMKRHMPFVKKNFSNYRMDEYPIRLWTVAVFLFGALPLIKKRGIQRLIIGDEYDTTREMKYMGIPHYDGLFDQSTLFDRALTTYFAEKKWNILQFSILRPMAEIMIQKVLVKRYPDLQAMQVSCHATHIKDGHIYPCGNCEKCRRIIAVLKAMDEDPVRCGYTEEQIEKCLDSIENEKINQIGEDSNQLIFLLAKKGLIKKTISGISENSNTMKLRFDSVASPPETIPIDIRKSLLSIMKEYTYGAIIRKGKEWKEYKM
jgi:7-cyano-7-deazaguanine synthase in queuosine biosynthesis